MFKKDTFGELIRFGIVGVIAVAIHYGVYWILQHWINVNVAYTIGYFVINFFLWIGMHRLLAPFAVLLIAVPTNFLIVRFVFKHFKRK